jgi:hypothetical protein
VNGAVQEIFYTLSERRFIMFKPLYQRSLSLALVGSLLLMLVSSPVAAAATKEEKAAAFAAKVKTEIAKLGTGSEAQIRVKLRDKTKLSGYVSQANADSFVITDPTTGAATEVPYPNVTQAKGKNLSTGAIIAISAAIAVGATLLVLFILAATLGD